MSQPHGAAVKGTQQERVSFMTGLIDSSTFTFHLP